jgi:hypothetical protein
MEYQVKITIPEKTPKPPLRQAHFYVPEQIYLEFREALKKDHSKMSPVIVNFMKNFVAERMRIPQR